jgi:TonB-dependent SusC/RagA subfamily outer membrane receptor
MFHSPLKRRCLAGSLTVLVFAAVAILAPPPAAAQTAGTIAGTVVDASTMRPVNGAQIAVDGSERGTLSDARGRFIIPNLPPGRHSVRVTNIGFRTAVAEVTVSAGGTARADFALEISAIALDEVVATGTAGAVEKRRLGASVGAIDIGSIPVPVASVGDALAARIPSVRSVTAAGGVGTSKDLRVRGTSSFVLGQRPVIYIDGVRVDNTAGEWAGGGNVAGGTCCAFSGGAGEDRISDINPEDIERIEVLKGAAAATLYGSEATNGVIQIFTKRGRNNSAPSFTFSAATGFNRHRENWPTKLYPNFTGPDGFQARDANELIENGAIQSYDLSVQGGGQDVTYFVAGSFSSEEGSLKPNEQSTANLRLKLQWLPSDRWSFDLNSAFGKNDILALQSGNNWTALYGNAVLGNPRLARPERPFGEPWTSVADIRAIEAFSHARRWTGGLTAVYQPSRRFVHRLTLGYDEVTDRKERLLPFGHTYVYLGDVGERNIGYRTGVTTTVDYLATLGMDLGSRVASDFSVGAQGYWVDESLSMAIGRGYAGPGVTTVGGAATTLADEYFEESITVGVFAQNRLSIDDRLFATLGLRIDGNSAFGTNYGLQPYPKADIAYLISEEGFLPAAVSNLKLRAAIGTSGLAPGAFDQFQTYTPTAVLDTDEPGVTPANPGNPNLEPEKTTEVEAGFEMGLLEDRVGVEFTAYRAITRDALLRVSLPPSMGFSQQQLQNTGEILNTGWELSLNTAPVVRRGFRWHTQLNLDGNRNEILSLGPNAVDGRLGAHREGKPVNSIWGYVIEDYDQATNRHTRSDTTVYFGGPLPTFNLSLGNTFTLGAFRLYGLISAERGAWFTNSDLSYRIRQGASDYYYETFENGEPTARTDSLVNYYTLVTANNKRDNVRIREVSLSYSVPGEVTSAFGMGSTTFTLSGQNLQWWDDCMCADPNMQYAPGSSTNFSGFLAMPAARRFLLSVRTSF